MKAVTQFSINLLGTFQLSRTGETGETIFLRRKTRATLAYLAAADQPYTRQALMDMFCQDANSPSRTLTLILSRIRKQVDALHVTSNSVQFKASSAQVDYAIFQQTLAGAVNEQSAEAIETAVSLYRGEFLEGLTLPDAPEFELWLLNQRARARHLLERGLAELIRRYADDGRYQLAIQHAQQLLHSDPLLEEAHAHLIWLYAQTGQRKAALQQYAHCRALLQAELAVEPAPELQKLHQQILTGQIVNQINNRLLPLPETAPLIPADFVGREAEVAQLNNLWQAALAGQGGVLLVSGVAGSGKSRLMRVFSRSVAPTAVLIGQCYASTAIFPYYPWIEIIEAQAARLDDASLRALPAFTQDGLLRLLPSLNHRLQRPLPAPQPLSAIESDHLFRAVVHFFTATASETPILLILDDLQWADSLSLHLFHYLATQSVIPKIVLLGAYRAEDMAQNASLVTLVNDLSRMGKRPLPLPPLSSAAIMRLMTSLWPHSEGGFQPELAARLARITGGNAFFVTELLQELAAQSVQGDTNSLVDFPVPDSVRELIQQRLAQMPGSSRQVVETLAVLGVAASFREIQQFSGRSEEETAVAIDNGIGQHFLDLLDTQSSQKVTFRHDLVREAISAQMPPMRSRLLHRRIARQLASVLPLPPGGSHTKEYEPPEMLFARQQPDKIGETAVRILHHARRGEAFNLILQWALPAARHTSQKYAYENAIEHLDAAREAYPHIQPDASLTQAAAEQYLLDILLHWLQLVEIVARPVAAEAAALAEAAQLLRHYPNAKRQAQWHLRQTIHTINLADFPTAYTLALNTYEHCMSLGDLSMAAHAVNRAAACKITMSQNRAGWQLFRQAEALYKQAGDENGMMANLEGVAWTALNLGEIEVAIDKLDRLLVYSRQHDDVMSEAAAMSALAVAWNFYYVSDKTIFFAEEAYRRFQRAGYYARALRARLYLGAAHQTAGNWDTAHQIHEETLAQTQKLNTFWVGGWTAQLLGRSFIRRGDFDEASRLLHYAFDLRRTSRQVQNQVSDLAWLGRLALAQGDTAAALTRTEQAIAQLDAFQGEFYVWEQPDVLMCRAEALAAAGQMTAAVKMARRAQAEQRQFAQQIADPEAQRQFMTHPTCARVETAVATQQFPLWP